MNELMGYSNVDNPYGDNNLTDKFKWHKKREMEEKKGISEDEARERDIARRRETVAELEKLKKRRVEREVEQAQHEQELVRWSRRGRAFSRNKTLTRFQTHCSVPSLPSLPLATATTRAGARNVRRHGVQGERGTWWRGFALFACREHLHLNTQAAHVCACMGGAVPPGASQDSCADSHPRGPRQADRHSRAEHEPGLQ